VGRYSPGLLAGGHLLAYLLTIFVLIVIPGPSVLFVVSRGVALGRRAALATVVGNTAGLAVLVVVVSLGLGSIVARSIAVFTAIKLAGAAYMVFLGIRMLRDRRKLAMMMDATMAPKGLSRMLREGFVVGVTNPKAMILLTAVLPQFVDPSKGHVQLQLALLGAISLIVGLFSDGAWAIVSGSARVWLARSPRRLELIGGAGGLVLIGLGVRLAITGRKD
jgi:threonine/homoserine/homoserine lactone efflux protein